VYRHALIAPIHHHVRQFMAQHFVQQRGVARQQLAIERNAPRCGAAQPHRAAHPRRQSYGHRYGKPRLVPQRSKPANGRVYLGGHIGRDVA
jgi:hypothetical protein